MKRFLRWMMVVGLLVSLTVPAMAAVPSPDRGARPEEGTFLAADGGGYQMSGSGKLTGHLHMQNASVGAEPLDGYGVITMFDEELPKGILSADVIFYVPGIAAGEDVVVRIYTDGQWKDVEATVLEDHRVELHLQDSGTIAILKKTAGDGTSMTSPVAGEQPTGDSTSTTSPVAGEQPTGANTSMTSPRTGESAAFPAACMMAVLSGAVAVVTGLGVWHTTNDKRN